MSCITLGVDLSTTKSSRGVVSFDWSKRPVVVTCHRERDLDSIAELARLGTTAIDAPFGWPVAFVEFVSNPEGFHERTANQDLQYDDYSKELRLRRTDQWVKELYPDLNPLSVSMDKLGATAVVCGELRQRIRAASARTTVIECYPKATAHVLGFDGTWNAVADFLAIDPDSCELNEHEVDATLAAITARCYDQERSQESPRALTSEGSIVLPKEGVSLMRLLGH